MNWHRDPGYGALKAFILEATGLDYYAQKDDDLYQRLQRRFMEAGAADCTEYLARVRVGGPELDALVNELTIGETYFFRHQEQYDALRELVIPQLIQRNAGSRRLQVWSAGCSIGPEPYSLAILLQEQFRELAGWQVDIVGTDINREALLKAQLGVYEEWSLRSLATHHRLAYFETRGRKFHLLESIKRAVSFHYHNLVSEPFLPPPGLVGALDVIICRNVTIYFDGATCARLIRSFADLLGPGGYLLVGHSEPNLEYFQGFEVVQSPGAILYRKPLERVAAPKAPAFPARFEKPAARPALVKAVAPTFATPAVAANPRPTLVFAAESVQSHLDRGEYEAALAVCERERRKDLLNPTWHFYAGKTLEELGRGEEAEAAFRKCLYLNRDHVMTHLSLGSLLKKKGRAAPARRHFETAGRLLAGIADEQLLPEAGNLKAGELKGLVRIQLEAA